MTTMSLIARRVAMFVLLVIAGILLFKLVLGAVVGFVKMVLVFALLAMFAFAAIAVSRR